MEIAIDWGSRESISEMPTAQVRYAPAASRHCRAKGLELCNSTGFRRGINIPFAALLFCGLLAQGGWGEGNQ